MFERESSMGSSAPATPVASAAKLVRIGILSPIGKLDPREAVDNISGLILGQIFEAPYAVAAGETTIKPVLFAEPLRRESALLYSAAVRDGVRFSDGTPVTADLVARSLRASKALNNKATVEARGNRVYFTLTSVNPRFELTLTQGNCAIVLDKGTQLLGTGAFMFDQRPNLRLLQNAPSVRLVRNPQHHGTSTLDEVQFFVLPAEADGTPRRLVEALRRGDVDLTTALTMADVRTYDLTGLTPSMQPGNSTGILFFNCERRGLSNANVRRGIATALDLHELASKSYDKNAVAFVAPSLLPPMMGRASGVVASDRAEAQKLLDESGAKPARLSLLVPWAPRPYMPKPLPVAQAIQKQLAAVGIQVDLFETKTGEDFFNDLIRGNYDIALVGWIADTPDPADYYEALLWSKMCEGENHSNHSRYKSAAMDAMLERFREAPTDENKRALEKLMKEEAPLLPIIYGQSAVLHVRKVRNVSISATGVLSLAKVTVSA